MIKSKSLTNIDNKEGKKDFFKNAKTKSASNLKSSSNKILKKKPSNSNISQKTKNFDKFLEYLLSFNKQLKSLIKIK